MLAANANLPRFQCSGSGIFAGRSGALKVFVSRSATTKILVAKVPIKTDLTGTCDAPQSSCKNDLEMGAENKPNHELGSIDDDDSSDDNTEKVSGSFLEALQKMSTESLINRTELYQEDLTQFTIEFLDFSKTKKQSGNVCNNGLCCNYTVEVTDNGENDDKVRFCEPF